MTWEDVGEVVGTGIGLGIGVLVGMKALGGLKNLGKEERQDGSSGSPKKTKKPDWWL